MALASLTTDERRQVDGILGSPDTIVFAPAISRIDVGAAGLGLLPEISDPVLIDGGGGVVLDGAAAGANSLGLWITAGNSTVQGLTIQRFTVAGIFLGGPGGDNSVQGNRIGTDAAGTPGLGNFVGVRISNSVGNYVGGQVLPDEGETVRTCDAPCNLISGNAWAGVYLVGPGATGNVVQGNFIGTDLSGLLPVPNGDGVRCDSPANLIGGRQVGEGNLISGNEFGVSLVGVAATGNRLEGNLIGTDVTGSAPLGNTLDGVLITEISNVAGAADSNIVGGRADPPWWPCQGPCNVISGNGRYGVFVRAGGSRGNAVQGNFIGTDATGMVTTAPDGRPLGNASSGVEIAGVQTAASGVVRRTVIGGAAAGEGNLISGNGHHGVSIEPSSEGSLILGNRIGTDLAGTGRLPNGFNGVRVSSSSNHIGASNPWSSTGCAGACNLISANGQVGVTLLGSHAVENDVQGNFIGTDVTGTKTLTSDGLALGNGSVGLLVSFYSAESGTGERNRIGGAGTGEGNLISGNLGDGIQVYGGSGANRIRGNYIGTDREGEKAMGNTGNGVQVFASPDNWIGSDGADACSPPCNVVSGNGANGIRIRGSATTAATGNKVAGNFIGTSKDGVKPLGNRRDGVLLGNAEDGTTAGNAAGNRVGGPRPAGSTACEGFCNLISGNLRNGVELGGAEVKDNHVEGNFIGFRLDGRESPPDELPLLPNGRSGVLVARGAAGNFIGGSREAGSIVCDGPCNLIVGNTAAGVGLAGTSNNQVEGNFIGVEAKGRIALPNGRHGVFVSDRPAAAVDGIVDPEAAYAAVSGFQNRIAWPAGVDPHHWACELQTRIAEGKDPEGYIRWHGYLFEILAGQELGWVRSDTPGTPLFDAIEVDAVDGRRQLWQMKSWATVECADIAGLLRNPDINLLLPQHTELPDCPDMNRVKTSSAISYFSVRVRMERLINYALTKSDCPPQTVRLLTTEGNVIGGERASPACDGPCNVIAGNREVGVALDGDGELAGNRVAGNYIGLGPADPDTLTSSALPNDLGGVRVFNAVRTGIGGPRSTAVCDGPCNVISGNGLNGVLIYGPETAEFRVEGNFIGVQPDGLTLLGNGLSGVAVEEGASLGFVGGVSRSAACDGVCNVIGGNGSHGVLLWGGVTVGNAVQGNHIGVDAAGQDPAPNRLHGVAVAEGTASNVVGLSRQNGLIAGPCGGPCNVLSHNGGSGITVLGNASIGNALRGNAFQGNSGQPIDLADDGSTRNDSGDLDPGPNELMNTPRLDFWFDGSRTHIVGSLDTPAPENAVVDVYEGDRADPDRLLAVLTPDESGVLAPFQVERRVNDLTAMATNGTGSSSELTPGSRPPLIFIPGIAGSRLAEGDSELWPGVLHLDRLSLFASDFTPRGSFPAIVATDVLRNGVYASLLGALTDPERGGYREYRVDGLPGRRTAAGCDLSQQGEAPTLFVFAYDWRQDVGDVAAQLRDYVACIRQLHPGAPVDILAHSLGGLVARRYILQLPAPADHGVRKLITLGSPFLGAPVALDVLETGDFIPLVKFLQPSFLDVTKDLRRIAGSSRGAHQALPTGAYFDLVGNLPEESPDKLYPLVELGCDLDGRKGRFDLYAYDDYVQAVDGRFGFDDTGSHQEFPATTNHLFHLRAGQDDWRAGGTGVEYHHFYGIETPSTTIGQLVAVPDVRLGIAGLFRCTFKAVWARGDGTVPLLSAERCGRPDATSGCAGPGLNDPGAELIPVEGSALSLDGSWAGHLFMTRNPAVQEKVLGILAGNDTKSKAAAAALSAKAGLPPPDPAWYVLVVGAAPAVVADDAGRSTAPSADAPWGTLPDVQVHALAGASQTVALPQAGSYTVSFRSAGEPLFLEVTAGTGGPPVQAIRYHDLSLPPGVTARLRLTPTGADDLRYDADGDGSFETVVSPAVAVTGPAAADVTPPVLAATWTQEPGALRVTLTAQDGAAAAGPLFYSLDGSQFHPYAGPVDVDPVASPVLWAFADDGVANRGVLVQPLPGVDLSVTAEGPAAADVGADITYTFTMGSRGARATEGIDVRITLPSGLAVVSCGATAGGACSGTGSERTVVFPVLAAGAGATITLTARADCAVPDAAALTVRARVASPAFDPHPANDAASAVTVFANRFAFDPPSATFTAEARSSSVRLLAPARCPWTAASDAAFLSLISTGGVGPGPVYFSLRGNSGVQPRTAHITVGAATYTVVQEGIPCTYLLSTTSRHFGMAGGEALVGVEEPPGCTWTAASNVPWVTLRPHLYGVVDFAVAPNPDAEARTGTLTIAGQTFTVFQEGRPCAFSVAPVAAAPGQEAPAPGKAGPAADLEVLQTASPHPAAPGEDVTFRVTVSNNGPDEMPLVVLRETLPPDLTVLSCTVTGGGACEVDGEGRTVRFPALAPGASEVVTVVLRPPACLVGLLTATAAVSSAGRDANSDNDSAAASVRVVSPGVTVAPAEQVSGPAGGTGEATVTVPAGCSWSATSLVPWINPAATGGSGSGSVSWTVAPWSGLGPRTGSVDVAGRVVTVTQGDGCTSPIAMGQTVSGELAGGDCRLLGVLGVSDRWSFTATPWQRVRITLSSSAFPVYVSLYDDRGFFVTGRISGFISYPLTRGGTYVIVVSAADGSSLGPYALDLRAPALCAATLTPATGAFGAGGGEADVSVAIPPDCGWTAASDSSWILLTTGATVSGNGAFSYLVTPFSGSGTRTGTITAGGTALTVTQSAGPVVRVSFPGRGGTGALQVSSPGSCPWTAESPADWIAIAGGATGSGGGVVTYQVAPNPGGPRTAVLAVAGNPVEVSQGMDGADFHTVAPCRVVDTRSTASPALAAGTDRLFPIAGRCGIPATARAVSVNVTVTGGTAAGHLRLFPGGTARPLVSAINYSAGQTRANNAIAPLGAAGDLAIFCGQSTGTVHVIVDVNGYFE